MKKMLCVILSIVVLLTSCYEVDLNQNTPQLVVEGYIDDGGFPVVMITTSLAITNETQRLDSLASHLLRWATVSVSDGENEVLLTGKIDESYFPPYIYTTSRMRGQQGKTYKLKVKYGEYKAEATTTIPLCAQIDTVIVTQTEVDSLCQITLGFNDNPESKDYYKVFVKKGMRSKQWISSFLGVVNDDVLNGYAEIAVNQGQFLPDTVAFTPFFCYDDTVAVKFARIDEEAYRFWNDYENYISLSRNPMFPLTQNLRSNIKGGMGCWYGCGATIQYLPLNEYKP